MFHQVYQDGDPEAPAAIKDRNGEIVLALCKGCGLAEGDLVDQPECRGNRLFLQPETKEKNMSSNIAMLLKRLLNLAPHCDLTNDNLRRILDDAPPVTIAAACFFMAEHIDLTEKDEIEQDGDITLHPSATHIAPNAGQPDLSTVRDELIAREVEHEMLADNLWKFCRNAARADEKLNVHLSDDNSPEDMFEKGIARGRIDAFNIALILMGQHTP